MAMRLSLLLGAFIQQSQEIHEHVCQYMYIYYIYLYMHKGIFVHMHIHTQTRIYTYIYLFQKSGVLTSSSNFSLSYKILDGSDSVFVFPFFRCDNPGYQNINTFTHLWNNGIHLKQFQKLLQKHYNKQPLEKSSGFICNSPNPTFPFLHTSLCSIRRKFC